MTTEKDKWVSSKIAKISKEGIRGKKPVEGQAAAVAYSMWRAKKRKK